MSRLEEAGCVAHVAARGHDPGVIGFAREDMSHQRFRRLTIRMEDTWLGAGGEVDAAAAIWRAHELVRLDAVEVEKQGRLRVQFIGHGGAAS